MRLTDVLRLALVALWQQRMRTFLTTLGVVGGSFVLIASLSLGQGVQETIVREYNRHVDLRRIDVRASQVRAPEPPPGEVRVEGPMSDAKRRRLEQEKRRRWETRQPPRQQAPITRDKLHAIKNLDHVTRVSPYVYASGLMSFRGRVEAVSLAGAPPDHPVLTPRLVAGHSLVGAPPNSVLVSEYLLYLFGITDEADVDRTMGQTLRIELGGGNRGSPDLLLTLLGVSSVGLTVEEQQVLAKLRKQMPELARHADLEPAEQQTLERVLTRPSRERLPRSRSQPLSVELTIRGVLRAPDSEDSLQPNLYRVWAINNAELVVADPTAEDLFFRLHPDPDQGLETVVVEVDSIDNVRAVNDQIKEMGLQTWCIMERLETERFIYLLMSATMTLIALVALFVAALGITNTMRMSVLERTREIGIMKAVGGRDLHLLLIFTIEGTLIGLFGSLLGLFLSWAASFPGDAYVRATVARRLDIELTESLFSFPWWLVIGAPLLVTLITTAAAVFPARKAARLNPITALRHD